MSELPPVADPFACRVWLAGQQLAYAEEPCSAFELIDPAAALYREVFAGGPSDFGVMLAMHLADLLSELWRSDEIEAVLDPVLPWIEAGYGEEVAIQVLALRCRMHLRFGRLPEALSLLGQLPGRVAVSPRAVDRAHYARAYGRTLSAQQQFEPAIGVLREAVDGYRACGNRGSWVDLYASISVAHRNLGDRVAERAVLEQGLAVAVSQRRWIAACNIGASVAEDLLLEGREQEAAPLLADAERHLQQAGPGGACIAKELYAAQAAAAALRGEYDEAIALAQRVVADSRRYSTRRQVVHRLKQLASWQLAKGEPADALATLREAHALELDETRDMGRRDMVTQMQRVELDHAHQMQARAEAHAAELGAKASALQQALDVQREMQAELIERSKLATLGHLLSGVAHEMNTPLGSALMALSTAADLSRELGASVAAGSVSRSRFAADLARCEASAALARRNIEQALALVQSYRHIDAGPTAEPVREVALAALVEGAWARAITPGAPLSLSVSAERTLVLPAEALTEVLLQLFQNVERHAYPAGAEGRVDVEARFEQDQLRLSVTDHGAGIAPELLPKVFDPYVSTQFGQGRSGLGLFVVQVASAQRLGGRIRVASRVGQGCRFELEMPARAVSAPREEAERQPPRSPAAPAASR